MQYYYIVLAEIKKDGFLDSIPQLIDEIPKYLDISRDTLDGSSDSVTLLDQAIERKGKESCSEPRVLLPIVAYIGEVVRRAVDGHWEIRKEYNEQWQLIIERLAGYYPGREMKMVPWIVGKSGSAESLSFIFNYIYDQLTDKESETSEYCLIEVVVNEFKHRLSEKKKRKSKSTQL